MLRDLTKDLQLLFRAMQKKNIPNQVIEGVCEGDTVEKLLQEYNLTLATAIAKCQVAVKKHTSDIANLRSEMFAAVG